MIALLFFIKPFKRLSNELLYVFLFVFIQFTTNLVATILEQFRTPNYSVYAINIILSFIVLSLLFYQVIDNVIHRFIAIAGIVFTICAVISVSNGDGIETYNSVLSAVASFMITMYCLVFFYRKLVSHPGRAGLTDSAFFWIIIGLFTYYTGSFFIFISYKYLIVQEANVIGILWRFHNVLLAIFCIYTIYGLACKNYQKI
ncbi:MAG: hypothetical protein JWQ78_1513 [Sediminibacterium sp.]|nr:hypothetical protein [Sediminibacterium sp.]